MKRIVTALVLSTLCLATSACDNTKRVAEHLPTPKERLVCELAGTRPDLPPEYQIDWARVAAQRTVALAVAEAKKEVAHLIATIRGRENIVAGYILRVEGRLFVCWTNMEWRKQYEAGIADGG